MAMFFLHSPLLPTTTMTVRSLHAVVSIKRHNQAHQSSPCIYSDRDSAKSAYTHTHTHTFQIILSLLWKRSCSRHLRQCSSVIKGQLPQPRTPRPSFHPAIEAKKKNHPHSTLARSLCSRCTRGICASQTLMQINTVVCKCIPPDAVHNTHHQAELCLLVSHTLFMWSCLLGILKRHAQDPFFPPLQRQWISGHLASCSWRLWHTRVYPRGVKGCLPPSNSVTAYCLYETIGSTVFWYCCGVQYKLALFGVYWTPRLYSSTKHGFNTSSISFLVDIQFHQ